MISFHIRWGQIGVQYSDVVLVSSPSRNRERYSVYYSDSLSIECQDCCKDSIWEWKKNWLRQSTMSNLEKTACITLFLSSKHQGMKKEVVEAKQSTKPWDCMLYSISFLIAPRNENKVKAQQNFRPRGNFMFYSISALIAPGNEKRSSWGKAEHQTLRKLHALPNFFPHSIKEWKKKWLGQSSAPDLEKAACLNLFLSSASTREFDFNKHINLGSYQPWQSTPQSTHLIGHSPQTLHLVELTEFIHLHQHFGPDEDPYGLEMAAFLDKAYVEGTGPGPFSFVPAWLQLLYNVL